MGGIIPESAHEERSIPMSPLNILLVEDNPADAYLTTLSLRDNKLCRDLHVVEHGEEALAFLRREGSYAGVFRPDLIILDLHLPQMDGFTVLANIKSDVAFCTIPVVIFSTSSAQQEITLAYRLGASHYFVKPNDLHECLMFGDTLAQVWQELTTATP